MSGGGLLEGLVFQAGCPTGSPGPVHLRRILKKRLELASVCQIALEAEVIVMGFEPELL